MVAYAPRCAFASSAEHNECWEFCTDGVYQSDGDGVYQSSPRPVHHVDGITPHKQVVQSAQQYLFAQGNTHVQIEAKWIWCDEIDTDTSARRMVCSDLF